MLRTWIPLAHDWKFLRDESPDAWQAAFDDSSWKTVSVPHCFNADDTFLPQRGYYRGPAWYRTRLPETPAGARVELAALGAFSVTHAWINGTFVGKFMGGYTGFSVNLTPHLRRRKANLLSLRVTSLHNPDVLPGKEIPDYNLYGGIYREIGLRVSDPLFIPDRGIVVSTPKVTKEQGAVHLNVSVRNDRRGKVRGRVAAEVLAPDGKVVSAGEQHLLIAGKNERMVTVPLPPVADPALWSPDSPSLYRVRVRLHDASGLVDEQCANFGFRWFRFDADKGFFLNDRQLKLHGANRHQDYPGIGNALPASFQAYDVALLKEMGANFVRCSHYPMHPAFLDACDRLGLLVLEEIASWQFIGGTQFTANAVAMMEEMIARDRHHPSIILWGLLNEGRSNALFQTLNDTARRCDPWRLTIYADNRPEEGMKLGTVLIPDVLGLNYKVPHLDELRETLKGLKLTNTEHTNANTGERRKPDGTLFTDAESEIWQVERIFHDLDEFDKREWMAGSTLWCMHDYGTDYEPVWPLQKSGVFDTWRIPKPAAHAIRARWTKEPFLRIAQHWTWPGSEGKPQTVFVFSNAEAVELRLNGRSLGTQTQSEKPRSEGFVWEVPYEPGTLVALGKHSGGELRDERRTAGEPAEVRLESLAAELPANGTDITLLTVTIVDKSGTHVPSADLAVSFRAEGDATFFGLGGHPEVRTRSGVGRIVLRAGQTPGPVKIIAESAGLKAGSGTVTMTKA